MIARRRPFCLRHPQAGTSPSTSTLGSLENVGEQPPRYGCAMQFSKWHALGNSYLVVEQPDAGQLTVTRVERLCSVEGT